MLQICYKQREGDHMPIYVNDMNNSSIKTVITCPSEYWPSMVVRFFDGSDQIIEGEFVQFFIKKYTNSNNRGITRTIGYELEEKLRNDFMFLFK